MLDTECYCCNRWKYSIFFAQKHPNCTLKGTFQTLHRYEKGKMFVDVREYARRLIAISGDDKIDRDRFLDQLTRQEKEELLPDETAVKEFEARWERKDLTILQEGSVWHRIITGRLVQPQYQSFPNKPEGFSLKFFFDHLFQKNLENEDPELYVFADYVRPNKRVEKM